MPSRIALHPGHPSVKPFASKSDCSRYTLFDGPASASGLARRASSGSWLRSRRSPMGRTAATCRCPGWSHGQTGMLTISSGLVHLFGTGLLLIVRAVVASQSRCTHWTSSENRRKNQVPSCLLLSFHLSTDPLDTTLFLRTRICPCGVRDPRHRSNGTFPSGPTVSRFSKVVACTIIQAMVFDSGGICVWQLNSSSFTPSDHDCLVLVFHDEGFPTAGTARARVLRLQVLHHKKDTSVIRLCDNQTVFFFCVQTQPQRSSRRLFFCSGSSLLLFSALVVANLSTPAADSMPLMSRLVPGFFHSAGRRLCMIS